MNKKAKGVVLGIVLIGVAALLWAVMRNGPNPPKATYSQFLQQVQAGQVNSAIIEAEHTGANPATYRLKDGSQSRTMLPWDYRDALEAMRRKMVNVEIRDASSQWIRVLLNASPFLLLVIVWFFLLNVLGPEQSRS